MMSRLALFLFFLLSFFFVRSQPVYFDDFNTGVLDTSKWNVYRTGMVFNNEQQAYVDSSATLYFEDGAMVIHPRYSPSFTTSGGQHFDFLSARIHTLGKFDFTYGKAEARIKMTEGEGLWPAWWLLGNGDWPATGEIDIMEFVGASQWTNAAVHGPGYSGNTPFLKRQFFAKDSGVEQWHVYGVEWSKDSMVFSVDGKAFYSVTRQMVGKYGDWVFDSPKHLILNFAIGGGYPQAVNKVSAPYPGLPAKTVELLKANRCRMLVDWVRTIP